MASNPLRANENYSVELSLQVVERKNRGKLYLNAKVFAPAFQKNPEYVKNVVVQHFSALIDVDENKLVFN
jgi:predicted metallopeptidase